MTQTLDCGQPAHEADCLCDVVVTDPVPINFGIHEVDHASLVIKYHRLGSPWSPDDLATLLAGLDRAREACDMVRHFQLDPEHLTTYTDLIKQMIGQGHSMVDIPNMVGLSLSDSATALMSGRVSVVSAWSEADWLAFEADLEEGYGRHTLGKRHSIPPMTAQRLAALYRT